VSVQNIFRDLLSTDDVPLVQRGRNGCDCIVSGVEKWLLCIWSGAGGRWWIPCRQSRDDLGRSFEILDAFWQVDVVSDRINCPVANGL
jgi:hypothetical protein